MEHVAFAHFVTLPALHDQQVLLRGNVEVLRPEAGDGEGDAIGILAAALDIEGRVIVAAARTSLLLEQVEETVETDGGAAIGRKIKTVHFSQILSRAI